MHGFDIPTPEPQPHEDARHHFHGTLLEISEGIVAMGGLITENVKRVGVAIAENRMELIPVVIDADSEVNAEYARLEKLAFDTLALQQPVIARDLRFIIAVSKMLYELERTGDLAVNLANVLDRINGFPDSPQLRGQIERLVEASTELFSKSLEIFYNLDAEAGKALDGEDDVVDDLVEEFYRQVARESSVIGLETGIGLTRMGRFLERIADHGVIVGDLTNYIVTAERAHQTHSGEPPEDDPAPVEA